MRTFLPPRQRTLGPAAPGSFMEAAGGAGAAFLKDIVAYVEVWSSKGTENYSKTFTKQLEDMGATVSKTFNKQVTHVIFKDGYQSTWDKAQKTGAKLVSVLWVEKCRMAGAHVDESLFPAVNTNENLPSLVKRKHKCMQPKDFIPKTPENDKRLQKKFEKMAEELQRQKTALDDGVPILLFESPRSPVCSSTVPVRSHESMMKKRLKEMKEKRENLSPTSSQILQQSQQNPSITLCEASLNVSHQSFSSDDSFASHSHSSFDALCGDEERSLGSSSNEMAMKACHSSPALRTSSFYGLASPNYLSQPCSQQALASLSKEGISWQKDAAGAVADVERKQSAGVPQGMPDEKHCLSPPVSTGKKRLTYPVPKTSSAKKKSSVDLGSTPKGKLKKRCNRKADLPLQLFSSDQSLQFTPEPIPGTLDIGASSYEDYFSPDNLKERDSERLSSETQPLASSLFHCRGLSKWERKNILEMCDFTCIGEKPRSISITDLTSTSTSSLEKPDKQRVSTASSCMPLVGASANHSPEHCRPPGPQWRGDTGPVGSAHPRGTHSPAHRITPLKGDRTEAREAESKRRGSPEEGTTPPASASPESEAHSSDLSSGASCNVEKSEEKNTPTGCSESVKNGPMRPDTSDSSCTSLVRPQKRPKTHGKEMKPMRTLVMTSMPSEKQELIIQVVNALKGFSFSPEVCESTTHVLVGNVVRTLNVLMGIARGCWILSYEWVLYSLEWGHWISEEPFELSETFPAALICRLERQLSTQQYQGTLFANQPKMFIAPASSPPRAKLCELVRLCGGQVSPAPELASLIIGPYSGKKEERIQYLSEKWVLDSITQHKVCDFKNYQLLQ
ncbi:microcephalin isoform X1 [Meriones unguiculatus]|uniref:microcephalin isoform X1 n=1 Tax=Meriones unguiculatus TaxID=10047 RepID=UPI00293E965F|nr:microcephalin isoform X1 [Meriones unguiculatus]